jgi:hypothetical protein
MRNRWIFLLTLVFWAWMGVVAPGLIRVCQAKAKAQMAGHPCCRQGNPCVEQWARKSCCELPNQVPVTSPSFVLKSSQELLNVIYLPPIATIALPDPHWVGAESLEVDLLPDEVPRFLLKHSFLC